MNDDLWLSAAAPRQLRVRGSIQVGQVRVSVPVFVLGMVIVVVAGIAVMQGVPLPRAIEVAGGVLAFGIAIIEGRWWGYTTPAFLRVLATHARRPRRLLFCRARVELPAIRVVAERQVRWHVPEVRNA